LLHYDEWDRVVALPRHKFITGATLLQLVGQSFIANSRISAFHCTESILFSAYQRDLPRKLYFVDEVECWKIR
jgi:hypothetical protein